jgi:uncharacterized protein
MKLAVVGSGISALGAAYYLKDQFEVTIFEKDLRTGGHSNTVTVEGAKGPINIDTGFIVHNDITYPLLVQLFNELQVERVDSDMSFSVFNRQTGLQFNGSSLGGLFAQRRRLLSPSYYKFLFEVNRFNQLAPLHLEQGLASDPLEEYLYKFNFSKAMRDNFIIPMGSAVWSTPVEEMLKFPAKTLISFFKNHGFLGLNSQYQWKTIPNGVNRYVEKLLNSMPHLLRLNEAVVSVEDLKDKCILQTSVGEYTFDKVLIATHAPDSIAMLKKPTELQKNILSKFKYVKNKATLHSDQAMMPPLKRVWSSWNFKKEKDQTATVYWMNRLQPLATKQNFFVSINEFEEIDIRKIHYEINYEHPLFDQGAIKAQGKIDQLNNEGNILFAGAWQRYGFHEDGLWSAKKAVQNLRNEVLI